MVGDVTVPGSYLHSKFVVQSSSNEDGVWNADSGASCHMTHDRTRIYNVRPPPRGCGTITIADRWKTKVENIGNMDVYFDGNNNQRITLIDVAYVPGLRFKTVLVTRRLKNTSDSVGRIWNAHYRRKSDVPPQ